MIKDLEIMDAIVVAKVNGEKRVYDLFYNDDFNELVSLGVDKKILEDARNREMQIRADILKTENC